MGYSENVNPTLKLVFKNVPTTQFLSCNFYIPVGMMKNCFVLLRAFQPGYATRSGGTPAWTNL